MLGTLMTLIVCAGFFALSQSWWRSYANPVSLGILAWTPALAMLNWPPYFLSPLYIHLNRPLGINIYLAMGMGFLSFWAGCALVKSLSPAHAFDVVDRDPKDISPLVSIILFGVGLLVMFIGIGQMIAGYVYPNQPDEITDVVESYEKK